MYWKCDGNVVQDEEEVVVDPTRQNVGITHGQFDVVWSNWEEEKMSLEEYQTGFHPHIREKVGVIERFITYTSRDAALIGFYRGRRVTELDARVLKGLTVYAGSLKLISDQVKANQSPGPAE